VSQLAIGGAIAEKRWTWRASAISWMAGAAGLFAISYVMTLLSDVGTGRYLLDKSWFLQVVNRVTTGDVLYRDVFFGATPLSVYLTAPLTQRFENAFLVAEALWAAWFVLLLLIALRIARQLGWSQSALLLLSLALIVSMVPWLWSPYSLLATLWLMVCCSAMLSWIDRRPTATEGGMQADGWLAVAGAAAGLCFASKQNLGVCAIAALCLVAGTEGGGWANRRLWPRRFVFIGGAFLTTAAAVLLPIVASGGVDRFLEYGFTNKGTYVRAAGYDYTAGLSEIARLLGAPPSLATFELLYWQLLYLLPPLAIVALLIAWLRSAPDVRSRAVVVLIFTLAATSGIYPRATLVQLAFAVPLLLLGIGYAVQRLVPGTLTTHGTVLRTGLSLWLLLGACLVIARPLADLVSGNYELARLPHFQGFPVTDSTADDFRTAEKLSAQSAEGDAIMLLSTQAGFLYLASGRANPTPFDYPLVTAFGHGGEYAVVEAIEDLQFRDVCLDPALSSSRELEKLQPKVLLSFVERSMEPRRDLGGCVIFRYRR
jgi:hypothetical protein